ncbi:MAG: sulfur carrier protein ThiS [Sphingomonadales bacterium]|nr:sulfur carrier protein ThiS [Sphingomonadales bacterium]
MIKVYINGDEMSFPDTVSVTALMVELGMTKGRVALEKNREIVPRSTFDEVMIEDGDVMEIVHFIGGG